MTVATSVHFGRTAKAIFPEGNPNLPGTGDGSESFTYDARGNVLTKRTRRADVISYRELR